MEHRQFDPAAARLFHSGGTRPSRLLAALHQRQIAWMSEARLGDTPVMRACITSYRTSEADIHWVVAEMNRLVAPEEQYAGTGQGVMNQ